MLSKHSAENLTKKIKLGVEVAVVVPIVFFGLLIFALSSDPAAVAGVLTVLAGLSPLWLPLFLFKYFWITWIHYVRFKFWFAQEHILLHIQLPPEVEKSPLAMEVFLTTLWNSGGEVTFIKRMWEGAFRPIWSLELASNEGRIDFYIHMRRGWKSIVESRIYGQFPEAQVREVEDYTTQVHFNLEEYDLWGAEYVKNPDMSQAVPIKTYVDYGLDKDPDVEYKVDPISNILEYLGTIGKDEHLWLQFILKARKKDEWYGFLLKEDSYKDGIKHEISKIMSIASKRAEELVHDEQAKAQAAARGLTLLTPGERTKVEALERATNKLAFEVGIRGVYVAKKDRFNGINAPGLVRIFDAFRAPEYNALSIKRWLSDFNYPWQDFKNIRKNMMKKKLFFLFQHRAYFYVPHDQAPNIMNVEELATVWHFPGSNVNTPGLSRVASKRSEAPAGLPGATQ